MKEIKEVGIEKELFLFAKDKIREPGKYGFPHDEFEFLVEIRSLPSDRLYPVYTTLQSEQLQYSLRANKFGMSLVDEPNMLVDKKWVDELWKRHDLDRFKDKDYTKNVYPEIAQKPSHHFGCMNFTDGLYKLTAGMHVHFSSRDAETGKVLELPIEDIVKKMDILFWDEISDSGRNRGEWEPKPHGFEYRSLPANTDVFKVLKQAFKVIRN